MQYRNNLLLIKKCAALSLCFKYRKRVSYLYCKRMSYKLLQSQVIRVAKREQTKLIFENNNFVARER